MFQRDSKTVLNCHGFSILTHFPVFRVRAIMQESLSFPLVLHYIIQDLKQAEYNAFTKSHKGYSIANEVFH